LDRRTRRQLLRGGAPHSDAVTAAVAVGYARTMRRRRWGLRTLRPMLWVAVVAVLAVLPAALGAGPAVPSWAIGCAVVLVTVAELVLMVRFRLGLLRMEQANAPALLAAEAPAPPAGPPPLAPAPGERFTAGIDHRKVLRAYVRSAALVVVLLVLALSSGDPVFSVPALFLFILNAGLLGRGAVRWRRQRTAVVTLDATGLELPAHELTAGWAEITEIRIVSLRGDRHPARVVVFVPADPEALLGRIPARRLRAARRATGVYGSPVAIADPGLDRTGEEIAAAAVALAGLPVRRFV
jgi:hypothetical protein